MDAIINLSEQYQTVAKNEDLNIELFNHFMNKITVWDYSCNSREHYLSLPKEEKVVVLRKYYTDIKARSNGILFVFFCLV